MASIVYLLIIRLPKRNMLNPKPNGCVISIGKEPELSLRIKERK